MNAVHLLWKSKQPTEASLQPSSGAIKSGLDLLAETVRATESQAARHGEALCPSTCGAGLLLPAPARAFKEEDGLRLRYMHIHRSSPGDDSMGAITEPVYLRPKMAAQGDNVKGKRGNRASWPGVSPSGASGASKISIKVPGYKPARGRARAKQLAGMTPDEIETERQARLERNRLCAKACRQRKKGKEAECQRKLDLLQEEVDGYKDTIGHLQAHVSAMESELARRPTCKCGGNSA